MIFSHGLGGTNTAYLGLFKEIASHGYVIMALDDINGSASYTMKQDGTQILFDCSHKIYDLPYRKK